MSIKHFFSLLILFCAASAIFAQTPQAFNYQAEVRDAQGNPLANQTMNFEISLVQNNAVIYGETQSKATDQFGLINLSVGQGTTFNGNFANINWGNSAITTRVKVNGVALPEKPLLAVPIALYALKSGGSFSDSWLTNGNNIYRASGNVGIGVQNPTAQLDVFNSIKMSSNDAKKWPALIFNNHVNQIKYFEMAPSGEFYLYDLTSKNYDIFFDNNGRVGIGTLKPDSKLYVEGDLHLNGSSKLYFQGGPSDPNYFIESYVVPGSAAIRIKGYGGVNLTTRVGDVVNIIDNGNVGIGITTPTAKLDVNGQIKSTAAWPAYYWVRENGTAAYSMDLNPNTSDLSIFNQIQGKTILIIKQDGTVSVPVLEVRGADIVEKFKAKETLEAGTLVSIDEKDYKNYKMSTKAYQKGLVGIVSGANGVKHGMLLEQDSALAGNTKVAIAGRVYVKATAQNGAIEAGDLLTSSNTSGYAMKASNRKKSFGTIVGKALTTLQKGEGYVLVLVGLQ